MADDDPRFHALCELPIDDQVKAFLRAFVFDFQVRSIFITTPACSSF
jgi:hypothetical protein